MGRLYGEMIAVPTDRVVETKDGDTFELGSAKFEVLHTPGHAKHHHALWEPATRSIFTGDTFGLAYPIIQPTKVHSSFQRRHPFMTRPCVLLLNVLST